MLMNNIMICLSYVVTIFPMIFGLAKWKSLPDKMAVHFSINGTPNGFAPKIVAVVVVPLLLVIIHFISTFVVKKSGSDTPFILMLIETWIVPVISIIVAIVIYRYALK